MQTFMIEIMRSGELPEEYEQIMNKFRKKEFGPSEIKNFKKDFEPGAIFFFVKDNNKDNNIVSFGGLREITVNYLNKNYNIFGLCNIISIKKKRGYGRLLMSVIESYVKKTGKTAIGFCEKRISGFYKKSGLGIISDLSERFVWRNIKTGELRFDDDGGDGIYIKGNDDLINKLLSTKDKAYYYLPNLEKPNW